MTEVEKPRKKRQVSKKIRGHHMNKEWVDLHETEESPLFWVDLSADSQLAVIQEKLAKIEERAAHYLEKPRHLLSRVRKTLTLKPN